MFQHVKEVPTESSRSIRVIVAATLNGVTVHCGLPNLHICGAEVLSASGGVV